ncbi:MAG TPA: amidohydrolase [Bacteroidales bacterium]|nr:amidohydrolase [Bacteroidales bacterium]
MNLLLRNATYIDWETLDFSNKNIIVRPDDDTVQLLPHDDDGIVYPDTEVIDCTGKLVTKSFAVGHHHAYSALARGMGSPKKIPCNFHEILQYVWWTLDKKLDAGLVEMSALVTAMECARNGSTFVVDHHASPFAVKGSLEIIARAFEKVGLSHLLCYETSDRDGKVIAGEGLEETETWLKHHQGLVGLHASFTVGDDTLGRAVELMHKYNSGIHIHVAEDKHDQEQCINSYGRRVVERLSGAGVLSSPKSILVHCLHLEERERELIGNSPAWVAENCESNLNNNVGYFNGAGLGENIMLGTDGMHSDMLQSLKAAFFVGQGHDNISYESAYRRFRNMHRYLSENGFKGDGANNLVVLNYHSPTPVTKENFIAHLLFGISSRHITDVISGGKLILRKRKIMTVDEQAILKESRKQAERLWNMIRHH